MTSLYPWLTALALFIPLAADAVTFKDHFGWNRFYKGNIHAHTKRSDGDSDPLAVMNWYRDQHYHFLALTDHNLVTDEKFWLRNDNATNFRLIMGEEVSWLVKTPGRKDPAPVHVTVLCSRRTIGYREVELARSQALKKIHSLLSEQKGAIGIISHPNYSWALDLADFGALPQYTLIELFNQHPESNNEGGTDPQGEYHPSTEALWDKLLTAGRTVYAVASDDMHDLKGRRGGGRGWIQVVATKLAPPQLCEAIQAGQFYSSTGVELASWSIEGDQMELNIKALAWVDPAQVRTDFITARGKVVATKTGLHVAYRLRGGESGYLRARVTAPGASPSAPKRMAWTQAVRLDDTAKRAR